MAVAQETQATGAWERQDLLNGCQAVAQGVRLADVDVIAAYPIRPYTEVMDALSKIIADGQLDAEYIIADSEHSQFEIAKHARHELSDTMMSAGFGHAPYFSPLAGRCQGYLTPARTRPSVNSRVSRGTLVTNGITMNLNTHGTVVVSEIDSHCSYVPSGRC